MCFFQVLKELLHNSEDTLSEWQDKLGLANEYDNSIFFSLPAEWEEEFYKDMDALNVSCIYFRHLNLLRHSKN